MAGTTLADTATPETRRIAIKLQLDLPGGSRIGPGKIRLLELIGSEGSLSRAARTMGLSYRRAWQFVQQVNAAFAEPAIATPDHGHGGAAAQLTPFGRELIRRYRLLEAVAAAEGGEALGWIARHQQPAAGGSGGNCGSSGPPAPPPSPSDR